MGLLGGISMAVLLGVTVPETSSAQGPEAGGGGDAVRYDRKSGKAKAKADLLDTKFKAAVAEEQKKAGRQVQMMEGAEFAKKRAAVEQEMADKQIEFLKRLIKSTDKSDPEYPDLLFRLSDHYLEKKAYFDLQAGKLYEQIYAAEDAGNNAQVKQLQQKQKRLQSEAKDASTKAARVYEALVQDPAFGTYKRMDEALYYYAFELGELGEEVKMQDAYKKLINNYPDSQFISQAYLAFADYYFGKGQIQNAVRLYEKVTQFKDSPVYAYALYKLAWCHLNPIGTAEAQYDKSLNYFVSTIKATIEGRAGSESAGKQLRRDARRDLVRAYVHASKPSKAWEFFEKWGVGPQKDENDARKMMELLANQYFGEGKYTESTFVYKRLQEVFSGDPDGCEWQSRIVVNSLATDNKEVQWNETKALGDHWLQFKDGDFKKAVKRKCRDDALDTMKQMATVWHDEAEKTKLDRTYELADAAYQNFLAVFPKDKDSYELQYYYAELLWALAVNNYNRKDDASRAKGLDYFRRAREQFVRTLELDPKGKYTRDAAFAQMLAMKNALEYDETGGKSKACRTNSEGVCIYKEAKKKKKKMDKDSTVDAEVEFPESDYTENEKGMLEAYDLYTKYVNDPKDEELPKIMYHRVKLMMEHNKFDEARPVLEEILKRFDGTVYAAWCSEMYLDMMTIKWVDKRNTPEQTIKASEELEASIKLLQSLKVWKHPEADQIRDAAPRLLAGIGWKKGMAFQDSGRAYVKGEPGGDREGFRKCAETFVAVYNEHEDHDKADTLLWNAALCSDAGYMVGQAISLRKILLERHAESQHAKDTLHHLGGSYQAVAYYADAADRYEQFAAKYTKDDRAAEALQNAYLFRVGLGQEEKAMEDLKKYEGLYQRKDPSTAAKIFWSRYDLLKTEREQRTHAEDYLKTYGKRGGLDRQIVAEAVIAQQDWRASCEEELLYDSCMTITRKRAVSAVAEIEKRKRLEERLAKSKKKKDGKEDEDEKKKKFKPPQNCGNPTQGIITVHKRDKKKSEAAQTRLTRILKTVGKGIEIPKDDEKRANDFRNAWGMAMVYKADAKYEQYMQLEMPGDLDFNVEDWKKGSGIPKWEKEYAEQVKKKDDSTKRFSEFYDKKIKLGTELKGEYAVVKNTASPYWVLAAAARTAMVNQNFADQLYRAEVPQSFKTQEQVWAYCDALADQAQPVQDEALAAFTYCIEKSTEYQFFNVFSRLCENEMQQRDADKYPATNEMFGESIYTASQIGRVGVLANETGEDTNAVKQGSATEEGKEGKKAGEGEEKEEEKEEEAEAEG
jgi:TolA-binding protein